MLRLELSTELGYEVMEPGCDFIFNVQAAYTPRQFVVDESLQLSQDIPTTSYIDPATKSRFLRLRAKPGQFTLHYKATVELNHHEARHDQLAETSPLTVPGEVLPYLCPSRY